MNTNPKMDDLLEGLIVAIETDILPNVSNAKAYATAKMMQSLIQGIRQQLPVFEAGVIEEHNQMTQVLRDMSDALSGVISPEADRIRERAATLGQLPDLPLKPEWQPIADAHYELGRALESSLTDLDVLQRAGSEQAEKALTIMRTHLGPRYIREVQSFVLGGGMIGRG